MVQIFEPLKIADSHATRVAEDIRQELNSIMQHYLLCLKSGRAVCCLDDKLGLKTAGIANIDGFLQSRRNEEITR
jgi:hypothetical protein